MTSTQTMLKNGLISLADECITHILEYLRAIEFANCCEVNKSIFSKIRIQKAIRYQLQHIYNPILLSLLPITASSAVTASNRPISSANYISTIKDGECRCDVLYIREVKTILSALNYSQSQLIKGYWVSTSWLSNTKKYFEALTLPDIQIADTSNIATGSSAQSQCSGTKKNSANKKQSKIRQRRGSDSLPPWPCMNSDITCCHGSLSVAKAAKSKRKLIDKKAWFCLRKFYPKGPQFKSTLATECSICLQQEQQTKALSDERKGAEVALRQILFEDLQALAMRKSGVPSHLLTVTLTRPHRPSKQPSSTSSAPVDMVPNTGDDCYSSYSAEDYDDNITEDNETEDNGSTSGSGSVDYNDYDFSSTSPYVLSRAHSRSHSESSLTANCVSPFSCLQDGILPNFPSSSLSYAPVNTSTFTAAGVANTRSSPLQNYRDVTSFSHSGIDSHETKVNNTPLKQSSSAVAGVSGDTAGTQGKGVTKVLEASTDIDTSDQSYYHFKSIPTTITVSESAASVEDGRRKTDSFLSAAGSNAGVVGYRFGNIDPANRNNLDGNGSNYSFTPPTSQSKKGAAAADSPMKDVSVHDIVTDGKSQNSKGKSKGKGKGGKIVISLEQFLQQSPLPPSIESDPVVDSSAMSSHDISTTEWYTPVEASSLHKENQHQFTSMNRDCYTYTSPCHSAVRSGTTEYNYKTANSSSAYLDLKRPSNTEEDADVALALSLQLQFDQEEEERVNMMAMQTAGYMSGDFDNMRSSADAYSYVDAVASSEPNFSSIPCSHDLPPLHSLQPRQPLLPGVYHIVPREWLRQWRRWLKGVSHTDATYSSHIPSAIPSHLHTTDSHSHSYYKPNSQPSSSTSQQSSFAALPVLDCTGLLCHAHGKLIVPPHLEEYLRGHRKNLLAGLGHYKGEVVEVLSGDEFDALQLALASLGATTHTRLSGSSPTQQQQQQQTVDFNIRFAISGESDTTRNIGSCENGVAWSMETCHKCDPFNYKNLLKHSKTNKGRPISTLML